MPNNPQIQAIRREAVDYATKQIRADVDWQKVQFDLINDARFAPLFRGLDDDAAYAETMAIIREGEEE